MVLASLTVVLYGCVVFTAVILFLVLVLQFSSSKLMPQGNVHIEINGDESKSFTARQGQTLLSTLMDQKILLPSACGGGGTCAMCRCQVLEGGGDLLPTEKGHLSREEQKGNWRLACQLKVKKDMKLEIEESIFGIKSWECTVRSNNNVATFIKEFVVELPKGEVMDFQAGGYIQIDIPKYELDYKNFDIEEQYREDWEKFGLFDLRAKNTEEVFRAYSMANHPAEAGMIMLNVRIASPPPGLDVAPGIASSYIFNLKPGDKVNISGSFGEFFMKDTEREIVFIGGGAGMAPMRSHIFDLFQTKRSSRKATFFYGARSRREMFYDEDFKQIEDEFPNFKYVPALSDPLPEDNWQGPVGFIHQVALERYLSEHESPEDIEYYLCGPPMMNSAVQDMLDNLGVDQNMIAFDDFG